MTEPLKSSRTCAVCGKTFIFHKGAGWIYLKKRDKKTDFYCSWKCMREAERKGNNGGVQHEDLRDLREGDRDHGGLGL